MLISCSPLSSLLTPLRLKVRLNLELSSNLLQQCKADFNVLSDTLPLFLLIFSKIIRAIWFLTTSSLPDVHLQQQRPFSGGRTCSSPLAWPRQVGLPRPITYKYYTGSSRKNVKSKSVCTGVHFHKKWFLWSVLGWEIATNLPYKASGTITITLRHPY